MCVEPPESGSFPVCIVCSCPKHLDCCTPWQWCREQGWRKNMCMHTGLGLQCIFSIVEWAIWCNCWKSGDGFASNNLSDIPNRCACPPRSSWGCRCRCSGEGIGQQSIDWARSGQQRFLGLWQQTTSRDFLGSLGRIVVCQVFPKPTAHEQRALWTTELLPQVWVLKGLKL